MEHRAGRGVWVLIEGHVLPGVASLVHQGQHPLTHAIQRAVVVGDMHGDSAAPAHFQRLAEGVQELVTQGVAGVGHVKAAKLPDGLTNGHQLVSVAKRPRRVGQTGRETERAIPHTLAGQVLHPSQFIGCGRPVFPAHGLYSYGGVGHHIYDVAGGVPV